MDGEAFVWSWSLLLAKTIEPLEYEVPLLTNNIAAFVLASSLEKPIPPHPFALFAADDCTLIVYLL